MSEKKTPTVTVNKTPSEQVTEKAKAEFVVTDSAGRKLTLRKPPFIAQVDLIDMLGDKADKNPIYRVAVFVVDIDGDPVPFPQSMREMRALLQRLDEHGFAAVADGVNDHFGAKEVSGDDKVKNS